MELKNKYGHCYYLRDEYKISENNNGFLKKESVKLIMKGLNI